jgi:pimeloyl-ACP methyl ester carboxylesterase
MHRRRFHRQPGRTVIGILLIGLALSAVAGRRRAAAAENTTLPIMLACRPDTVPTLPERWHAIGLMTDTSPAEMLPIGVPQAIISGALDPIVPAQFGRAYAAKATAAGDPVREITISDAGHF